MTVRSGVALIAAGFLAVTTWLNLGVIPFPTDNDLDEIGWLVRHLSLDRPESLANENYPLGLPVLLRLLTPEVGGLLATALTVSAIACTALVVLSSVLARRLGGGRWATWATAALVSGVAFRSATSEFADSIGAALFLGSLCLSTDMRDRWGRAFAVGLGIGLAFTFRYHYLIAAVFVASASPLLDPGAPRKAARAGVLLLGFADGAAPDFAATAAAGSAWYSTGVAPYLVGHHATRTLDWEDYLGTYELWPIWRMITENTPVLLARLVSTTSAVLLRPITLAALVAAPFALRGDLGDRKVRVALFLALCAVAYVALIPIPTQITDRAMLPGEVLFAVLAVRGAAGWIARVPRPSARLGVALAGIALLLAADLPGSLDHVRDKRAALRYNRAILADLREAGMQQSREVFSNDWDLYPLHDAEFVSFYNYGGWILLDSEYARHRPPPRAREASEWLAFARERGIRFLVLRETPKTRAFFEPSFDDDGFGVIRGSGEHRIFEVFDPAG